MKHAIRLLGVLVLVLPAMVAAAPQCKVVITPTEGSTVPSGSFEFKATVQPASCSQALIWTASEGTIDDGHFRAPIFTPQDKQGFKNVTIQAKQKDDPHAVAMAIVKVTDADNQPSEPSKAASSSLTKKRQ